MKNSLFLLLFFLVVEKDLFSQGILKPEKKSSATFLAIPVLTYSQETRFKFGLSGLYAYFPKKSDSITRVSNLLAGFFYTQNHQFFINPYFNAWSNKNTYHYVIDFLYANNPEKFYGINSSTLLINEDKINIKKIKTNIEVEKKISENIYIGLILLVQKEKITDISPSGIYLSDSTLIAKNGATLSHVGWSAIYDSRNHYYYTTKGSYIKFNFTFGSKNLGSDYSLGKIDFQWRKFFPINNQHTIASQTVFKTIQGSRIPFNFLNQLGGDNFMRGYFTGRFRDQNILGTQIEYRYRPFKYFAFSGFAGLGEVFSNRNFSFNTFKVNYGIGARFFMDLRSRLTIRVDYGWGEKPVNEKRIGGLIIGVSEAF